MYIPKQKANKKNNNLVITPCESSNTKKRYRSPKRTIGNCSTNKANNNGKQKLHLQRI